MMYRQGDILLIRIDFFDKELIIKEKTKENLIVLAEGEKTGHLHAIKSDNVICYQNNKGELFLDILEKAYLNHGLVNEITKIKTKGRDHNSIEIPAGKYKVIWQREYSPKRIRRVTD